MYARVLAVAIALASSVWAQNDWAGFASGLGSKYGPPLLRETFTVLPGVEMIVDYAANGNVCRMQLPPMGPEPDRPGVESGRAIDEFLKELIPEAMRGKKVGIFVFMSGLSSVTFNNYQDVSIAENFQGSSRTGVTVTFPHEQCRDQKQ